MLLYHQSTMQIITNRSVNLVKICGLQKLGTAKVYRSTVLVMRSGGDAFHGSALLMDEWRVVRLSLASSGWGNWAEIVTYEARAKEVASLQQLYYWRGNNGLCWLVKM
jgi:hypothetical protein